MKKLNTEDEIEMQKQNIGNAGEYYFAARLSARNFIVTITLGRAERYDILAVSPTGKTYKFSLKTRYTSEVSAFTLSDKDERKSEDDLFYAFIRLHGFKKEPEFWIIPSKRVSEIIKNAHQTWRVTPGMKGQAHNDSSVRRLPIVLKGSDFKYYPKEWEEEIKGYYNNFSLIT